MRERPYLSGMSKKARSQHIEGKRAPKKKRQLTAPGPPLITGRERKSCLDKVPYATRAEANLISDSWGRTVIPYHCEFCGQWHLTSAT